MESLSETTLLGHLDCLFSSITSHRSSQKFITLVPFTHESKKIDIRKVSVNKTTRKQSKPTIPPQTTSDVTPPKSDDSLPSIPELKEKLAQKIQAFRTNNKGQPEEKPRRAKDRNVVLVRPVLPLRNNLEPKKTPIFLLYVIIHIFLY
ncbi:hypothetical protein GEMRC1_010804 [Eukaryota sp. GEM-RC1]